MFVIIHDSVTELSTNSRLNKMKTQIVRTVTFLAQYAQIRNFTKKYRVSSHNLFLLGKRNPTSYLTLKEDHKASIYDPFLFIWKSAPSPLSRCLPQKKKVKFQVCFYQSLTDNMVFLKWSY